MGANSFSYDCNGNMISRTEGGVTYAQQFNAESQLTVVTNTATGLVTTFYYDGDGKRVLLTRSDGSKVAYPSGLLEVEYVVNPPSGNIVVDRFDDPSPTGLNCTSAANDCSLRAAVITANVSSNVDVIALPSGTYTLTRTGSDDTSSNGDLDITNPVTITGAGADITIIKGNTGWTDRIFHVLSGKTATLTGVTITGGNLSGSGGGVLNAGNLTISNTAIISNTASVSGGGLQSNSTSVLTMTASAILTNTANGNTTSDGGGGLYLSGSASATVTNVTLSGNKTQGGGGGLYFVSSGSITITNGTVMTNTANSNADANGDGGGLERTNGTLRIQNTIVAGNADGDGSDPDCDGTITSSGYNHIQSTTGCTFSTTTGDVTGSNPNVANLANNGGPTLTHLPNSGSAVINAGNTCPTLDQRGYGRNGVCDKGAAEFGGIAPASIVTKTYYFAGAQLVALREITTTGMAGTLYYLHQDHLGSTSLTTNSSGTLVSKQLFYAYGEVRWSSGTTPTTIGYTGQRRDSGLGSLMFYNARYYSPLLSRFVSADTLVPEASNSQDFNRYAYVRNNPLKYIDPTGHFTEEEIAQFFGVATYNDVLPLFDKGGIYEGRYGWLAVLRRLNEGDALWAVDGGSQALELSRAWYRIPKSTANKRLSDIDLEFYDSFIGVAQVVNGKLSFYKANVQVTVTSMEEAAMRGNIYKWLSKNTDLIGGNYYSNTFSTKGAYEKVSRIKGL